MESLNYYLRKVKCLLGKKIETGNDGKNERHLKKMNDNSVREAYKK